MEFLCCYTRLTLKEVDRIERNRWTESIGMSGQGRAEQVDRVVRNTQNRKGGESNDQSGKVIQSKE